MVVPTDPRRGARAHEHPDAARVALGARGPRRRRRASSCSARFVVQVGLLRLRGARLRRPAPPRRRSPRTPTPRSTTCCSAPTTRTSSSGCCSTSGSSRSSRAGSPSTARTRRRRSPGTGTSSTLLTVVVLATLLSAPRMTLRTARHPAVGRAPARRGGLGGPARRRIRRHPGGLRRGRQRAGASRTTSWQATLTACARRAGRPRPAARRSPCFPRRAAPASATSPPRRPRRPAAARASTSSQPLRSSANVVFLMIILLDGVAVPRPAVAAGSHEPARAAFPLCGRGRGVDAAVRRRSSGAVGGRAGQSPLRPLLPRLPRPERQRRRAARQRRSARARCASRRSSGRSAPSLRGVGALAADFYLRTGYMPLSAGSARSRAARASSSARTQIRALTRVRRLARRAGRRSRSRSPRAGASAEGLHLFTEHCAGCHQIVAAGRLRHRRRAAAARRRDTRRRSPRRSGSGPYVMPRFSKQRDLRPRSSTRSSPTSSTRSTPTTAAAGRSATSARCPEGLVTWFIAAVALVALLPRDRHEAAQPMRDGSGPARAGRAASCGGAAAARARADGAERAERIVPARRAAAPRRSCSRSGCSLFGALCAARLRRRLRARPAPAQTQLLGLSLGLALLCIAAALIVTAQAAGRHRGARGGLPAEEHPDEQEAIAQTVAESGSRITRRRLFTLGLRRRRAARSALALLAPLASLGPVLRHRRRSSATPWRRGRRLVDENGRPYRAADIEQDAFYTAFPEGADREQLGSPLVVVRLPPERPATCRASTRGYAADGIVAYSKICTHAGCAISLYRDAALPARRSRSRRSSAPATTRRSTRRRAAR